MIDFKVDKTIPLPRPFQNTQAGDPWFYADLQTACFTRRHQHCSEVHLSFATSCVWTDDFQPRAASILISLVPLLLTPARLCKKHMHARMWLKWPTGWLRAGEDSVTAHASWKQAAGRPTVRELRNFCNVMFFSVN